MRLVATMRVQVLVEVEVGTYSATDTFESVYKQAARDGVDKVRKLLGPSGLVCGEPRVRTIVFDRDVAALAAEGGEHGE